MPSTRTLGLRREALAPLTTEDMNLVVGGSHACGITDYCADTITHGPSIDQTCPSVPVTYCLADIRNPISYHVCL